MNIKAVGNDIIFDATIFETKTYSGIIIPANRNEVYPCKVISVGDRVSEISPGDTLMLRANDGRVIDSTSNLRGLHKEIAYGRLKVVTPE